ncbi:TPA: hypothetical protein ACGW67_005452 [Bacillus tropicus]
MLDIIQFDNTLKETLVINSLLPLNSNSLWCGFDISYKFNENERPTGDLPLRRKIDEFVPKNKRGLYVLVDPITEEVLYIGEGWIRNRLHEHKKII